MILCSKMSIYKRMEEMMSLLPTNISKFNFMWWITSHHKRKCKVNSKQMAILEHKIEISPYLFSACVGEGENAF